MDDAISEDNLAEAEQLCLQKILSGNSWTYRQYDPGDWNNVLVSIYEKTGQKDRLILQLTRLLYYGNTNCWNRLRDCYKKEGTWETHRAAFPEDLAKAESYPLVACYRHILVEENETDLLFQSVDRDREDIGVYAKYL